MKAYKYITLLLLLDLINSIHIKNKFIEGFDFDAEEQQAIELDEQESKEAYETEKRESGEPDLDLCSDVDLGDPFEEW